MKLKELIERAEKKLGTQKELGAYLGQSPSKLRDAKSGRCGLPNYACVMIADLIGEEKITVIAASELVTETKEERRKVWSHFVSHVAMSICACVILNMTPSPAEASTINNLRVSNCLFNVYYVKCFKKYASKFKALLRSFFKPFPESLLRYLTTRVDHMAA